MALTLDGVPLLNSDEVADMALGLHDPLVAPEVMARSLPSSGRPERPWGPFEGVEAAPTLHAITWPAWGLHRCAIGVFLAHATHAQQLRVTADANAASLAPMTLAIEALAARPGSAPIANTERVELPVYLLPPRPAVAMEPTLTALPGQSPVMTSAGVYLLTVVDRRYFLRFRRPRPDLEADLGCDTSWGDLYAILAEDAGIALTWDKVDDAYLIPPRIAAARLARHDAAIALDMVAASIGQRIVARLDGTFHAQNHPQAQASRQSQDDYALSRQRRKLGGGSPFRETL